MAIMLCPAAGTGARNRCATLRAIWPNVLDLRMDSPNSQVLRGDLFSVSYWYHQVWSNGRRRVEHFAPRGIADLQPYIPTNGPAVSCGLDNPGHLSRMPRLLSATETN